MHAIKSVLRRARAFCGLSPKPKGGLRIRYNFKKNLLNIEDRGGFHTRNESTTHLFLEAFTKVRGQLKKDFDVSIFTGDRMTDPPAYRHFAYCAAAEHKQTMLIPDFVFWSWPEAGISDYELMRQQILAASQTAPADHRLFWIGNPEVHSTRKQFLELAKNDSRILAQSVTWNLDRYDEQTGRLQLHKGAFVSLPEHCQYRYLLDLQGNGYSGRLKLLLFSGRPVFLQQRTWREYFFTGLRPFEHYIPVREDLSDLSEKIDWAESHPAETEHLARQGQEFAKTNLCRTHAIAHFADSILQLGGP